jgi:(p)ppGpp synthase/HD superfamily hydrolase
MVKMKENLIKAKVFAATRHSGQKDNNNEDYYMNHLLPVCEAVMCLTNNEEIWMAAILHDTLEDTSTTYEELEKEFGTRVADLVNEVTHEGSADEYGFYFPRLKSQDAILIKLCDRASNISRMQSWNEKRKQHYLKKTKFWKDESNLK